MTVDLHYSVRADAGGHNLYFKPAKLNGVALANRNEVVLQYSTVNLLME